MTLTLTDEQRTDLHELLDDLGDEIGNSLEWCGGGDEGPRQIYNDLLDRIDVACRLINVGEIQLEENTPDE